MFFHLTKAAGLLLQPSMLGLVLLGLGTVLSGTRWRRAGRWLLVLDLLAGVAITFLPVSDWVTIPLENRFARPARPPAHIDGILVLGAGEDRRVTASRGIAAMPEHAQRLITAAALLRAHPEAVLYFSGGGASAVVRPPTEADIAREILSEMGSDMKRVRYETKSRSTWENLVFSKSLAQPKPGETWVLVTSALQMPRAIGIARRLGWTLIAYPTDYTVPRIAQAPTPSSAARSLAKIDDAAHEWEGLLGYWLAGKTSALFPGPIVTPAPET